MFGGLLSAALICHEFVYPLNLNIDSLIFVVNTFIPFLISA